MTSIASFLRKQTDKRIKDADLNNSKTEHPVPGFPIITAHSLELIALDHKPIVPYAMNYTCCV